MARTYRLNHRYGALFRAGRGRLIASIVASIAFHVILFADWRADAFFLSGSRINDVSVNEGRLVVFLKTRPNGEVFPSLQIGVIGEKFPEFAEIAPIKQVDGPERIGVASPSQDNFLTQDKVSSPAQPLSEINIPWPPGLPVIGVTTAVFTVFIDELGRVKDVVPDGHTLPPAMEDVARNAFLAALFRPALREGKAVKSIKRIQVEFEYLPSRELVEPQAVVSETRALSH